MLGLLLARAGVEVLVIEKHADFLRDFRGDRIHPSTFEVVHELGLLDRLLELPHEKVYRISAQIGDVVFPVVDFSHLPTRCRFVAFMPQSHPDRGRLDDRVRRPPASRGDLRPPAVADGASRRFAERAVGQSAAGTDGLWQRLRQFPEAGIASLGGAAVIPTGYAGPLRGLMLAPGGNAGVSMTEDLIRSMALSLTQARLCLDCDCLTDDVFCPRCDRDSTVPIAGWFRPLDDGPSNASRHRKGAVSPAPQWVLIVQPHQRDLYRVLREALAGTAVQVLYERRVGQRRRTAAAPARGERRRTDRRRPRPTAVVYRGPIIPKAPESAAPNASRATGARSARPRRRQPASVSV